MVQFVFRVLVPGHCCRYSRGSCNEEAEQFGHRYWREMAVKFSTKEGRAEMIAELSNDADVFEQLDKDIREATKLVREKLDIKEEELDAGVEHRTS